MENKSFPRDLLQRFTLRRSKIEKTGDIEEEEGGDIELSLGLSLNGRFGVDPQGGKNIIRSASISNLVSTEESTVCSGGLTWACSLPAETEEERRKRKDFQSMKRMEAKRKRLEKLKNVRVVREKVGNCEENGEKGSGLGGDGGLPPSSQGSIGSQGSGSSGVSDFGSQPIGGTNKYSLASVQPLPEQKIVVTPGTTNGETGKLGGAALENPNPSTTVADKKEANETATNMMADMPCVSTRGDGLNGKTIEGFLYKYKKGEEVKIVCVCHGSSLSPAEFVKHAGGGDVAHPLRHIVVNTSSSFLQ